MRESGVATEKDEAVQGLSCVAAPIFVRGVAIAAVSVALRSDDPSLRSLVSPVRQAAAASSRALLAVA